MPIKEPESLFETTLKEEVLDPSYVHLRDSEYCKEDREYIDSLWKKIKDLADKNFHDQIQRKGQFHSHVWEMRLECILNDNGFQVEHSNQGPDIRIPGEVVVHIEAVASAPDKNKELEGNYSQARILSATIPENELILRYTQSLQEKWVKYCKYREKGFVGASDAFVIAISAGNLSISRGFVDEFPWILKPLFGIGRLCLTFEEGTFNTIGWEYEECGVRYKKNRSSVEADLFLSDKRSGISAIIFSPQHIKNRPLVSGKEEGSDLLLCHNPYAEVKLPEGFFEIGKEWAVRNGYPQIINDWTEEKKVTCSKENGSQ